jgi:hypothetical protein
MTFPVYRCRISSQEVVTPFGDWSSVAEAWRRGDAAIDTQINIKKHAVFIGIGF